MIPGRNRGLSPVIVVLAAGLFAVARPAEAAIALDSSSSCTPANASSFTWSHTTSGGNGILLVGVATRGTGGAPVGVSGVTYAGTALTNASFKAQGPSRVEIWRLVAPATGTNNVVVTLSTAAKAACGAVTLTGVDQSSPIDATATASGNNNPANFTKVWGFDNPTYTDLTTAASNTTTGDVPLFRTDSATAGDFFYVGRTSTFVRIIFTLSTLGAGVTLAAEYWNGSAWTALTVSDGTLNLTANGHITFTRPGDWATTAVNGSTQYWVRLKTTTNPTTAPVGTRVQTGSYPTVTVTTVTDNAWVVDAITFSLAGGATGTAGPGQTERWSGDLDTNTRGKGSTEGPKSPAGAVVMDWNLAALVDWAAVGVAVKPAVVTATPGSFNAYEPSTPPAAITGVIRTKVAGVAISVDLIALNSTKTAILTTFTGTVKVELLDASNNAGKPDANGCRPTWTVIQTPPNVTFAAADNGRKNTSFTENNVWRDARIRVTFPAAGPPSAIGCSNNNFAIRPASFSVSVTDATWTTAGTTRALTNTGATGGNVHKAGQNFTITVTPAPGTATNYNGDPTVSVLACTLPATCANGTLVPGAFSGSGTRVSNTATYTEAGAFNLTLIDQTFASVDSADGTPADCSAAGQYVCHAGAPLAVGRFVPDRFAVTAVTAPMFRTMDATDAACTTPPSGPVRSFTYIGQFSGYQTSPVAMITAQNASGGTTTNYRGALWKLTGASASQTFANSPVETLDTTQILAPTVTETPNTGTGTLTANAADKLAFMRNNASPRAPFNANLSLTWSVSDASEAGAGQGTITTATPLVFNGGGSGIAFDGGDFNAGAGLTGGKTLLYGRLRLGNANGSQLVPLPVPVETQYWNGTAFITNAADHCTTLAGANITMANFQGSLGPLASCKTRVPVSNALTAGRGNLLLTAPGSANTGSVDLTVQLGSGTFGLNSCVVGVSPPEQTTNGAGRAYLQGNWTGGAFTVNPTARATFGVFKGSEEVIFIRENF